MQTKFESLERFIKLSSEESKRFLGGDLVGPTKVPSSYNTSITIGGKTSTIKDLDSLPD